MFRWDILGLGVGLIKEGEIIHARGYGVQGLVTMDPVTPDVLI